jgi:hypothetical protein
MSGKANVARLLSLLIFVGLTLTPERDLSAQRAAAQQTTPEGYVQRGLRPGKGLAPGMKVTDLGKGARTYRVNLAKGDEIMSGLTEFAEKYHLKLISRRSGPSTEASSAGPMLKAGWGRNGSSSIRKRKSFR